MNRTDQGCVSGGARAAALAVAALAWMAAAFGVSAEMEKATPESQGVDSAGISAWIDACERVFDGRGTTGSLHGFVITRHGKTIAEGSWKPFDTLDEPHMLYSHSKSFTSSAIGILADDGKLDLDERLVDIFPDMTPAEPSGNLKELRIRDLLTMNMGANLADAPRKNPDCHWAKTFLANRIDRKPGTRFKYDSSATYMLSCIVERKSGMKLMDFLRERMFRKIGIEKAWSTQSPQGIDCGGWGMNMTTRELARFGVLYLQKGSWGGERVLSPEWVALATARHTWNGGSKSFAAANASKSDWAQGYGFQFWRCRHGCYRADGAFGQYTIVMPEKDATVSIHAGLGNMQKELDLVWDFLLPAMKDASLPENRAAADALAARCSSLALAPVHGTCGGAPAAFEGKTVRLAKNKRAFESVRFDRVADGWDCSLATPAGLQRFRAGCGEWKKGKIKIDTVSYENLGGFPDEYDVAASAGIDKNGAFAMRAYLTGTTAFIEFRIDAAGKCTGTFFAMDGCDFKQQP